MSHITTLPNHLSYAPSNDLNKDGYPIMTFDISKTFIEMIPERLKGVDRVMVRAGQLQYIAPDYNGQVHVLTNILTREGVSTFAEPMDNRTLKSLKAAYQKQQELSPDFFYHSYSANKICGAYPEEEIHLPAGLAFHWNPQELIGILNAGKTWITKCPKILNIPQVIMPNPEKLQRRLKHEKLSKRKENFRNKQRDYGFIRYLTGEWHR